MDHVVRLPVKDIPFIEVGPDWQGETCAIIATGPSLNEMDLSLLAGVRTIALNDAMHAVPQADVLLLCDRHWTAKHPEAAQVYKGPQIIVLRPDHVKLRDPRMGAMQRGPHDGVSLNRAELNGKCTAVSHAVNLAVHKGVRRILLLGVDLQPGEGHRRHYHDDERDGANCATRYGLMAASLATQAAPLRNLGIAVVNCSPRSLLRCYPTVPLAEAITAAHA